MLGRKSPAEEVYGQLLEIYPDDFIVSLTLVSLLKDSGRCHQALTFGRRLENRYSSDKTIYIELVDIYWRLDKRFWESPRRAIITG